MAEGNDSLTRARAAYTHQDWRVADRGFAAAVPDDLTADDLAARADCAFWLGRRDDTLPTGWR